MPAFPSDDRRDSTHSSDEVVAAARFVHAGAADCYPLFRFKSPLCVVGILAALHADAWVLVMYSATPSNCDSQDLPAQSWSSPAIINDRLLRIFRHRLQSPRDVFGTFSRSTRSLLRQSWATNETFFLLNAYELGRYKNGRAKLFAVSESPCVVTQE
jgi:hypothetical protein